ncbi:MotA/TolQ/ExbB proton channel family protein [Adhaeretor mobilis]|uniref:Biopolymer transport protein ExbB n=1 Tax=Adhaeretor mobilis TaxID=1930276 RepID=A0A517MYG3_9BACT|nr:MotA/TolQ/ExbB proton channel family protein [Adhaeretor mobilis]QDS99928.1 Biopolymer transport protein ExbB [Adhaeretor mobilis]
MNVPNTKPIFRYACGFAALALLPPATALAQEQANAAAEAIPTTSLWEMLLAGGPLLIPIAVCSFVLLLAVFERLMSLRRSRVSPRLFVERFLLQIEEDALGREEALRRCRENRSLIAEVFESAVRKWGKPAVEVEQAVLDEGERATNQMRRFLRVINGVATVCPLMGLLGTVWGMMEAFNAIAGSSAMGRPELLAGGISGALLSTAAGLFVAIPALILYLFFVGRVDMLTMEIDRKGQQLVNLISAEGVEDRKNRPKRTSAVKKKAA